jgi:hypothetical protein
VDGGEGWGDTDGGDTEDVDVDFGCVMEVERAS